MKFLSRRAGRAAIAVAAAGGLMFCAGVSYAGYSSENLSVKGGANRVQGDRSEVVKRAVDKGRAQNVILLIGDGMGDAIGGIGDGIGDIGDGIGDMFGGFDF